MKNSNPIDISTTCKLSIHPESFYWGKVAAPAVFELFWQLEIMVRWICIQVFSWGNNKEETKKRRPLHYLQVIQQQSILAWLWQLLSLLEFGIVAKLFFPFLKIQYNIIYKYYKSSFLEENFKNAFSQRNHCQIISISKRILNVDWFWKKLLA